jgi:hypothetical protein
MAKIASKVERYVAKADQELALNLAATESPFTIEVRFMGGLTATQKAAFKKAADRWTRVIVGDLPNVLVDGEVIDDLVIVAQGSAIDGTGHILGQAGPTRVRPATAGASAFLPARGKMAFDTADLKDMELKGTLLDVITHEMGHVLGIGTIWSLKGLLNGAGTSNPTFTGPNASREYGVLKNTGPTPVPVENTGGPGTADGHWRESVFRTELMTGFVRNAPNELSRMTVASLQDLGYVVDMNAAEQFVLPNLLMLAEAGLLVAELDAFQDGIVLPSIPVVLDPSSMR